MDNHLMIFESTDFGRVRSVLKDGAPWFVAVDVCKALGLNQVTRAMSRLDSDEGGLLEVPHPQNADKTIEINAVSEAGLYHLILCSKKPEARAFKRWITHEVIPSIRKHGAYMTDSLLNALEAHPEAVPEYLNRLRSENALRYSVKQMPVAPEPPAQRKRPKPGAEPPSPSCPTQGGVLRRLC